MASAPQKKSTIAKIKEMNEKELLQFIAYSTDRTAKILQNFFTAFSIAAILWVIFTFVGPLVQKAAGL